MIELLCQDYPDDLTLATERAGEAREQLQGFRSELDEQLSTRIRAADELRGKIMRATRGHGVAPLESAEMAVCISTRRWVTEWFEINPMSAPALTQGEAA